MTGSRPLTVKAFDELYSEVSNWGRWGSEDEYGTLNHLTAESVIAAAGLVATGRVVSMARDWDKIAAPDNPRPALHYLIQLEEKDSDTQLGSYNGDFIGSDYHGRAVTHVDALCHYEFRGHLYNGTPQSVVNSHGSEVGSIMAARHGVVGRGVLFDVPRHRGIDWLEPGEAVLASELQEVASEQGVELGPGDIFLLRTGHYLRRSRLGPWVPFDLSAGLDPTVMSWLNDARVSVLGADSDNDARPSLV
jgi:hypothetical protein